MKAFRWTQETLVQGMWSVSGDQLCCQDFGTPVGTVPWENLTA